MSYQEEKLRQPLVGPGVTMTGLTPSSTSRPDTATVVRKTITSAQLLALHTTTIVVVPKAGTGTVVVAGKTLIEYDFGATAYTTTSTGVFGLKYTDVNGVTATATVATTGFIDQSSNQMRTMPALATSITPVENADLVLDVSQNPTLGDGTLVVTTEYSILSLISV